MYDFEQFTTAGSVEEAVTLLDQDPLAIPVSGGTDILIKLREGKLAGCHLVSIHGLDSLNGVTMDSDGTIHIRPGSVFSSIVNDPLIQKYIPMLATAADQVGGPQIRNMGTIGGNICNGVTSADSAPALLALNAQLTLVSKEGSRQIPLGSFYTGPSKTIRAHNELLTDIVITPDNYERFGGHYIKYGKRNAMEISTLGCAVNVRLSEDKSRITDLRLAYGVAAPTPIRCPAAEQALKNRPVNHALLETIQDLAVKEIHPRTSWRASREFRIQIAKELASRTLTQAIINAGGDINA